MVEESVFPLVFLDNPKCLDSVQGRNPSTCSTQKHFFRELVKELITSSGISPSLTPRGPPRRLAVGLTSPTWISFPRENTGHREEDQHHPILCSLFSYPEDDFSKERGEEQEAWKSDQFSVHCLQSGLVHPRLLSAVPHCSGLSS